MESSLNQDEIITITMEEQDMPELLLSGMSIMGTREYQQDAYYMEPLHKGCLAVICDGMGGLEHGEDASRVAVEKLAGDFEQWSGEESVSVFLQREAIRMDQAVVEIAEKSGGNAEMGTTTVSVIVQGDKLFWLAVGDSRIYISRGNEMVCVTRDHNYGLKLLSLMAQGEISEEEFQEKIGRQDALISFLGMNGLELVDVNRIPFHLQRGDRILLCSDGLYKCLTFEHIKRLVQSVGDSTEETVKKLIKAVEDAPKKGKDNTTVILLEYK